MAQWQMEGLDMDAVPCHYNCKTPQKGYTWNKPAKQAGKTSSLVEQPQIMTLFTAGLKRACSVVLQRVVSFSFLFLHFF